MSDINLRHGIFLPPFHPNEEDPTQCLERDLELMTWLDKLGFHEAWIGEHHSAGFETISSPEILLSSRKIVCCSGVSFFQLLTPTVWIMLL